MSVHQTTDGRWFVKYYKGKNPDDPNRTREYFGRGLQAEAEARRRNHELGLGMVRSIAPSRMFGELADSYLKAKGPAMAKASLVSLSAKLSAVILPYLGTMQAMQITPEVLDRFVAMRLKNVKRTTVHRDLSDIRAILRWAVKRKYIAANPMDGFELPKRDDAVIKPPTNQEIRALISHATPHLKRAVMLSYYTGLRAGEVELLRMTWSQVDIANREIEVVSADKGGLKRRRIPITDDNFLVMLERWLDDDREDEKAEKKKIVGKRGRDWRTIGERPVVTYCGKRVASIKTAWNNAKKRAGITRRLRMYDIRHAFATALLDDGADLKHVSEMLGHRSVQQTVDTYQHRSARMRQETISRLPSIMDDDDKAKK